MSNSNTELKHLTIYCTICAGVVSHLLLFVCLAKDPLKCFRNTASYLVTNLAVADFIVCTFGVMRMASPSNIELVLQIISFSVSLVSYLSIFSIALDRYMLTVHPFKHRVLLNRKRLAIWIASIWLLSLSHLAIEFTLGSNLVDEKVYNVTLIIVALLSVTIYIITYISLRKHERHISQRSQCQNRALQREFLKTILIVATIQIVTLVPPNVFNLVKVTWYRSTHENVVHVVMTQMYSLNFAINPFLYMWRLQNYRRTLCLVFRTRAR